MNINDFIFPFDALPGEYWQTDSALHAAVAFTVPNGCLLGMWAGFDLPPVSSPVLLKVTDGGTLRFKIPITQDGLVDPIVFRPALVATDGADLVITLEDGGAGVTGYLNIACPPLSPLPPAFVQQAVGAHPPGSGTPGQLSVALAPAAGNSLFVCCAAPQKNEANANTNGITSVALVGAGGALTRVLRFTQPSGSGNPRIDIWYVHDVPAGVTGVLLTVADVTGAGDDVTITANVSEWSGLVNQGPLGLNENSANSTAVTTNPVTPSSASAVVIAMVGTNADLYLSGPTNSFTRMTQANDNTGLWTMAQESAYQIESSVDAYATGWALTSANPWAAAIVAFGGVS